LREAREDYETAIRLEKTAPNPDSERLITYTINLKKVEEQIQQKR
jgi:hypothetical protein